MAETLPDVIDKEFHRLIRVHGIEWRANALLIHPECYPDFVLPMRSMRDVMLLVDDARGLEALVRGTRGLTWNGLLVIDAPDIPKEPGVAARVSVRSDAMKIAFAVLLMAGLIYALANAIEMEKRCTGAGGTLVRGVIALVCVDIKRIDP